MQNKKENYISLSIIGLLLLAYFIIVIILKSPNKLNSKLVHTFENLTPILILIVFTYASIKLYFLYRNRTLERRLKKMSKKEIEKFLDIDKDIISSFETKTRSRPCNFGYKITWIAAKSTDIQKILSQIKYNKIVQTNWEIGVNAVFKNSNFTFITPSIKGWTLILNPNISYIYEPDTNAFLKNLSMNVEEIQVFGSFRGTGFATWGKFKNNKQIRVFVIDDGDIFYSSGILDKIEIDLIKEYKNSLDGNKPEKLKIYQQHNFENLMGNEDDVLKIAENWSINPMKLDEFENDELGFLIE